GFAAVDAAGPGHGLVDAVGPGRWLVDAVGPGRWLVDAVGPGRWLVDAVGPGHGLVDAAQRALIATAARTAGLLLDPTYTAKALQVAVTVARRERGPVVFWHTGGVSAALS